MVCWHSDEAARPFVNDVDLPLLAFNGGTGNQVGIETIADFRTDVNRCVRAGVGVNLAEDWVLTPTPNKPNRLGPGYAGHQAQVHDSQIQVPDWYNY